MRQSAYRPRCRDCVHSRATAKWVRAWAETGRQIMRLLRTVVQSEGITALVATHDATLTDLADDVLTLEDGRLLA